MNRPPGPGEQPPGGDPWAAFGYLVSGVALYGAIGWGLSVWLHADYLIPIGILVGAALGMYMVIARFRIREPHDPHVAPDSTDPDSTDPDSTNPDDAARVRRPNDDRGETA